MVIEKPLMDPLNKGWHLLRKVGPIKGAQILSSVLKTCLVPLVAKIQPTHHFLNHGLGSSQPIYSITENWAQKTHPNPMPEIETYRSKYSSQLLLNQLTREKFGFSLSLLTPFNPSLQTHKNTQNLAINLRTQMKLGLFRWGGNLGSPSSLSSYIFVWISLQK